jgi:hypothetical protein
MPLDHAAILRCGKSFDPDTPSGVIADRLDDDGRSEEAAWVRSISGVAPTAEAVMVAVQLAELLAEAARRVAAALGELPQLLASAAGALGNALAGLSEAAPDRKAS